MDSRSWALIKKRKRKEKEKRKNTIYFCPKLYLKNQFLNLKPDRNASFTHRTHTVGLHANFEYDFYYAAFTATCTENNVRHVYGVIVYVA